MAAMEPTTTNQSDDSPPGTRGTKFQRVADRLRRQIVEGAWPVGTRIPTEQELVRTHQVGLNTVRRAIDLLADEGMVRRRQGSGTYVTRVPAGAARPRFVGVLVPTTAHIYPRVLEGIEEVTAEAGIRIILASSEYDPVREDARLRELLNAGVDGLLLVPNLHRRDNPQRYVDELRQLPVPYVLVERRPPDPAPDDDTRYVCTDHIGGVYAAIRHLVDLGHERIGHLGRSVTATATVVDQSFRRAIADFGLPLVSAAIRRPDEWSADRLVQYARACHQNGVTAVFGLGDRDVAMLLPHARRLGLTVPDHLAVVAYDDDVAELAEVPLTTVARSSTEVGRLAAEVLLRRIHQGESAAVQRIQLQPRLAVRASCGAHRGTATAHAGSVADGETVADTSSSAR